MGQGDMSTQYLTWVRHPYQCPPPMFEHFNLETAWFSIQLIANAWIFSARNLRMSRSVLFSEQPASNCLNWLQVSLDWVQFVQYCTWYLYRRIGWVIFQPQDHCIRCKISNECIWSTLGQVKCDSVCGRCYVAVFQVLGNGVTWPNNFRFYALLVMRNHLAKVT